MLSQKFPPFGNLKLLFAIIVSIKAFEIQFKLQFCIEDERQFETAMPQIQF